MASTRSKWQYYFYAGPVMLSVVYAAIQLQIITTSYSSKYDQHSSLLPIALIAVVMPTLISIVAFMNCIVIPIYLHKHQPTGTKKTITIIYFVISTIVFSLTIAGYLLLSIAFRNIA